MKLHEAIEIFNKIHNCSNYLKEISVHESSNNQQIIFYLEDWLDTISVELHSRILPRMLSPTLPENKNYVHFLPHELEDLLSYFTTIQNNLTYFHKIGADIGVSELIKEIGHVVVHDELKNKQFFVQTVSEYDFSEESLNIPDIINTYKEPQTKQPNILAITSIYHENPLMWVLMSHEYGHIIFKDSLISHEINNIISDITSFIISHDGALKSKNQEPNLLAKNLCSEVFADLFSLRACGSSYLAAFYFHELIGKSDETIFCGELSNDRWRKHKYSEHPPAVVRIALMYKEMEKCGFSNDLLFSNLMDIVPSIKKYYDLYNNHQQYFEEEYELYWKIYNHINTIFDHENFEILQPYKPDIHLIKTLQAELSINHPIPSTRIIEREKLIENLNNNNDICIDKPNSIRDIIYSGWICLINDLMPKIKSANNLNNELELRNPKPDTYSWKYDILLHNLSYSINTSVIMKQLEGAN